MECFGAASYVDQNGYNNYGYAVNIFGQTGQVVGFLLAVLLTITNPSLVVSGIQLIPRIKRKDFL